jgi:hypothetical protein
MLRAWILREPATVATCDCVPDDPDQRRSLRLAGNLLARNDKPANSALSLGDHHPKGEELCLGHMNPEPFQGQVARCTMDRLGDPESRPSKPRGSARRSNRARQIP